jgi:RimJ/RimL family protein N-acetyltransferase
MKSNLNHEPLFDYLNKDKFMSMKPDPMEALLSFQQVFNNGMTVIKLDADYVERYDEINGAKRYCYAKIVEGEVQALATFGQEDPIEGLDCYSVNYSVSEKHRRRGLAVEVVNKGLKELKMRFGQTEMQSFYIDAIIDVTNNLSIKVAKKIFSSPGQKAKDRYSGTPSVYFQRLIVINSG